MNTIVPITLPDLTQAKVDGTGAFDVLMRAMVGHLEVEFKQNRLRGADYANVYLTALQPVLQNAVVFLLQKDEAANKAALVQAQVELTQAQKELVLLEIAREVLTKELIQAQVDKIRRDIVSSDVQDAAVVAQTDRTQAETLNVSKQGLILDNQLLVSAKEIERATAEIAQIKATTLNTSQELLNLQAQECLLRAQYDLAMLNKLQTTAQTTLIQQKTATEKAQTVETGVDDNSVIGRQKILYKAQSDGFLRDAEQKAAKLMTDTWNVRRTTDESTVADATNMLNDATIGRVVQKMLAGVNA